MPRRTKPGNRKLTPTPAGRRPLVGVFVETSSAAGRQIIAGIVKYARTVGPWALHLDSREQMFDPNWTPLWLDRWRGSGLIARLQSQSLAAAVAATGVPVVDVLGEARASAETDLPAGAVSSFTKHGKSATGAGSPFPLIRPDDEAIGRLAAEHMLDRRFQHFAIAGIRDAAWSYRRQRTFVATVQQRGCPCELLEMEPGAFGDDAWDRFVESTAATLRRWPRPLGVMLAADCLAPAFVQACDRAGLSIPEDVAIIGVDADPVICDALESPMSSIDANWSEVGFRAAATLDRLMSGALSLESVLQASPALVAPRPAVERPSTEVAAIGDALVAAALEQIRKEACDGVQVPDIAARLAISTSALQRRFRARVGRSVHAEILRVQLDRAMSLLRDSPLGLGEIAQRAGFKHREYMGAVFKARLGVTPGDYRRNARRA